MSRAFCETQTFRMAWLRGENPLPDIQPVHQETPVVDWDETLTGDDMRWYSYGHCNTILPYRAQDDYSHDKKDDERTVVVLENEHMRAEFLPWMGGRLRSLRKDGRELLSCNPVIQPCNLALRNAWCSGGVEWNIGLRGHHMLTCSPMFTELFSLDDGTAGVRFYEFERMRGVVYRVEAYLPADSRVLFVQVTIENPADNGEIPMYWWSNMAVEEGEGTRIIVPADRAFVTYYRDGRNCVSRKPFPMYEGRDASYPVNLSHAIDFFYDIPAGERKFIAALKHGRQGLVQFSTDRLLGRKLFVWGMNPGGRHWQSFLADEHTAYAEIQAGIAHTQNEHIPMPADATWSWLEGYGELTVDDVTDLSFSEASRRTAEALEAFYPRKKLLDEQAGRGKEISRAKGEIVGFGSGWGAVENLRRAADGLPVLSAVCRFPEESIGEAERQWKALLDGNWRKTAADAEPLSYMTSEPWRRRLEDLEEKDWDAWYRLGVARWRCGDAAAAKEAVRASLACEENGWAYSALADMEKAEGNLAASLEMREKALGMLPEEKNIFLRYGRDMLKAGRNRELLAEIAKRNALKDVPRVKAMKAAALIRTGEFGEAKDILLEPLIIPDMQEGEVSLGDLWDELNMEEHGITAEEARAQYPLPKELDFRMN